MTIIPIDGGMATYFAVQQDGKIIAQGCRALCEAVIDGTVPDYIAKCEAERVASGIGIPRPVKAKKQSATKPAAPPKKAEQLDLL